MIKPIDDSLYSEVCRWWEARGWPILPKEYLPKRGYISFLNDKPIIAGFLYKDETATMLMLEWVVANPDTTPEEREESFADFIKCLVEEVKALGGEIIYTTSRSEGLSIKLEKNGFVHSESNMKHFLRSV